MTVELTGNALLDALPPDERERLTDALTPNLLELNDVLFDRRRPTGAAYFPIDSVLSIVVTMSDGQEIEVATAGREGMAGIHLALKTAAWNLGRTVTQVGGQSLSMDATRFQEEVERPGPFRDLILRYAQFMLAQAAQSAACNRRHHVEERCARWLLTTHDRVPGDSFHLTQEFLATMLGTRRASVTVAAQALQDAGLIRYRRGHINILDRDGLEKAACECYGILRREQGEIVAPLVPA